ncbi:microcin C transport system substrate-binding protein [Chromohalobacter marismortui]|uniref:Microcin C transport system substrate-binding protein n=1 Tax=Chromohalobacter marismortui TaxID=42055 RepID=A0A4R7NPF5_9GAMM|nr:MULTISPECIES: extracellular solute-binding protein [Chromohalobacter]MCI0508871.1 extracellular solute-binding protein [Chromohalobacter sp.]MCI0594272.1 extracellular solute-binding protein [Chromohalobacter sp.]TDU22755.1 microcin C transport system substrate-binding protein [Chromohalobacter marismortui]
MLSFVRALLLGGSLWAVSLASWAVAAEHVPTVGAISLYDAPALPDDFTHLPYTNPDAPKGGEMRRAAQDSFDSTNPFILQGNAAAGLDHIYDTLMEASADEPFTMYGLLAGGIRLDPDRHWMEIDLRPTARFHDGHPVTAEDVVFSFRILREKGQPFYRAYYANVDKIEALDDDTVRFEFSNNDSRELPLILGQLPVLPKHYWQSRDFASPTLDKPLGSGPYEIASLIPGRRIVYRRVEDYWGRDLPINRGRHNIGRLVYDYYRDQTVALEAFKAGNLDLRIESSAKNWATAYDIPARKEGFIKRMIVPDAQPAGMQAFVMNLRREKFQDRRVREALTLATDFDWLNTHLFYGAYQETDSYFESSDMEASGLPSEAERQLLAPYRDILPPEVFNQPLPISRPDTLRARLKKALSLLRDAGYEVRDDVLVDTATGRPLRLEFLLYDTQFERVTLPLIHNLERLGIQASLRVVDVNQYLRRRRNFDFDLMVASFPQSANPGNEQREYWTSDYADAPRSRNLIGLQSPALDGLVDTLISADSRRELDTAARALDRVLRWGFYVIPQWHLDGTRVALWDKFGYPQPFPEYTFDLSSWWVDPQRAERVEARQHSDG